MVYNPDQNVDIVISTKKPLEIEQVIELLSKVPDKKKYTVTDQQQLLNETGYYCGHVDGSKGPKTVAAIKAFQRLNKRDETGVLDQKCMAKLEALKAIDHSYNTIWFNDSEVHLYIGSLDTHEIGLELGQVGKLEKLSEMDKGYTCMINGQFFGGGREGLGMFITKGLYYFKPVNDLFTNWIQYKDGRSEIRDVKDSELWEIQRDANFAIGTSWPLIVNGETSKI